MSTRGRADPSQQTLRLLASCRHSESQARNCRKYQRRRVIHGRGVLRVSIEGDPPSPLQLPTSRRFNKDRLIDLGDSSYVAGFPQLGGIHSGRDLMGMVPSGLL